MRESFTRLASTVRRSRWAWVTRGPWRDGFIAGATQLAMVVAMAGGGSISIAAGSVAAALVFLSLSIRSTFVRTAAPILTMLGALNAFGGVGAGSIAALTGFGFGSWIVGWMLRRSEASRRERHIEAQARTLEFQAVAAVGVATAAFAALMIGATQISTPAIALPLALLALAAGVLALGQAIRSSTEGGNADSMGLGARLQRRQPETAALEASAVSHPDQIISSKLFDDEQIAVEVSSGNADEPGRDATERGTDPTNPIF